MSRGRRRKFKVKFNVRPDTVRSIISILFVSISLVTLISFFAPSYSLNSKIQHFLRLYFGRPSIVIPIILGSFGVLFIDRLDKKYKEARIFVGLFLLLFSLSGFIHTFISKDNSYGYASDGKGGGLFGYKISSVLSSAISKFGAGLFLLLAVIGSVFLIFNISFEKIFDFISNNPVLSAVRERLKTLFSRKSEEGSEVEVDLGTSLLSEDGDEDRPFVYNDSSDQPEQVPIFEVIPSPSEPQGIFEGQKIGSLAVGGNIKPNIPTDRIWSYPPTDLLNEPPERVVDTSEIDRRIRIIKETLKSSGVDVDINPDDVKVGPTVTQYAIKPKSPTYISKIVSLHKSLALALASPNGEVRIEAPIPGKSLIGIEVPNSKRTLVYFKSLIESSAIKNMKSRLAIVLGEDVAGKPMAWDISKMPHMLIAGSTGSGKSVFIHSLLSSLLFRATPQEVKFIIIDPKSVELREYEDIPHLLAPVVTDMDKTASVFMWAVEEMEKRYKLFEKARAKNIDDYNEKSGIQVMPYIVIVVDEFGDIMIRDPARIEDSVIRLAQKGRAAGVHLILATQRPSADAITGLIRANITCRVAFRVQNQIESRVIIGMPGAEKLIKNGDMLFLPPDASNPTRIQAALITTEETASLTKFLRNQALEPDYEEDIFEMPVSSSKGTITKSSWGDGVDDELFDEAVSIVYSADKASASLLQRKLRVGFARASRLIDTMEERGIIGGEVSGSKGREVLIDNLPGDKDLEEASGFDAEDFAGENFPRNQRDVEE
jgi:S-DNA-T family DNA segregation ATPase FtsK/SpoIIIE